MPFWDTTINYVPVTFPQYKTAKITMQQGGQEFWRVVNAGANTIMNLQVRYDGVPQPYQIVAFDGVPTGSKDVRSPSGHDRHPDERLPRCRPRVLSSSSPAPPKHR